ncbi:hypothetical protein Drorol1_Dr00014917 [Drosera rotundifolia]
MGQISPSLVGPCELKRHDASFTRSSVFYPSTFSIGATFQLIFKIIHQPLTALSSPSTYTTRTCLIIRGIITLSIALKGNNFKERQSLLPMSTEEMGDHGRGTASIAAIIIVFLLLFFLPHVMGPVGEPGTLMLVTIPLVIVVVLVILHRS